MKSHHGIVDKHRHLDRWLVKWQVKSNFEAGGVDIREEYFLLEEVSVRKMFFTCAEMMVKLEEVQLQVTVDVYRRTIRVLHKGRPRSLV